jgi:uncharacterized protein
MNRQKVRNLVFIVIGSLFFAIGIIGVFVPVLPTTPFLLLASFFYLRSSKRMHHWLLHHRVFGTYIRSYLLYHAIPKKTKLGALFFLWATLIVSMLVIDSQWIRILLLVVGISVSAHLCLLKTLSNDEMIRLNEVAEAKENDPIEL